jgi:hypothetical protein
MGESPTVIGFVGGALCLGFLVVSLNFLNFWRRTRDGLFLAFAAAFALLAVNQALVALLAIPDENRVGIYLLRLAAFGLIIWAVLRKNVSGER